MNASQPATQPLKLFPYQTDGVDFLAAPGGPTHLMLCDEPGLGKTPQAIRAADRVGAKSILVVCPAVACENWVREFCRFSPQFRITHKPVTRAQAAAVVQTLGDKSHPFAMVVSYETSSWLWKHYPPWRQCHFDLVVVDEAHFIKSPDAQRTKALVGNSGVVHRARRLWALTGTPMPNHPGELWVMLYVIGATRLGYQDFLKRYCRFKPGSQYGKYSHGSDVAGATRDQKALAELKDLLSRFALRRRKADVLEDLPPIRYTAFYLDSGTVTYEVTPEIAQTLKEQERLVVEAYHHKHALLELEALAQSVSTLRRYVGLRKAGPMAQMIADELQADPRLKLVVFAIHKDVIAILRDRLQEFGAVVVNGATPAAARQRAVDDFQTNTNCRVFIGNIKAAGTAITLSASHNVVFVEREWTNADNEQAAQRVHRIGQTMPVLVRNAVLSDSIDEMVDRVLTSKASDAARLLN